MIVFAVRSIGTLFGRSIVLSMLKKKGQGELDWRLGRLFLILYTAFNQKMPKKNSSHRRLVIDIHNVVKPIQYSVR